MTALTIHPETPLIWHQASPAPMWRFVLLAVLLHVWLVLMLGNAPAGTAEEGKGVFGRLNITLQGDPVGSEGPPMPPQPEATPTGATGDAPSARFGGAVRETMPQNQANPGAAQLGNWSPSPGRPDQTLAAPAPAPAAVPPPEPPLLADAILPAPGAVPSPPSLAPEVAPATPAAKAPEVLARLPQPAAAAPALPEKALEMNVTAQARVSELPAVPTVSAAPDKRLAPTLTAVLPSPALSDLVPLPAPAVAGELAAVPKPNADRALARLAPVPSARAPAAPLPTLQPATASLPTPAALPALPTISPAALPSLNSSLQTRATTVPATAGTALAADSSLPVAATAPQLGAVPLPVGQPDARLRPMTAPSVRPAEPALVEPTLAAPSALTAALPQPTARVAPAPTAAPTPVAPTAAAQTPGAPASPTTSQAVPAINTPTRDVAAPVAGRGAPDAGSRLGQDVATRVSTPASAPKRLNLQLPQMRGGELSRYSTTGVLPALPRPPEVPDTLGSAIEKTAKEDCRKAHANLGLLAVVPLVVDALRDGGCKW